MTHQENSLFLIVADDGSVPSPASLSLPELIRGRHFGLVGMIELTNLIDGRLKVNPLDEGGTILTLEAPLPLQNHQPVNH